MAKKLNYFLQHPAASIALTILIAGGISFYFKTLSLASVTVKLEPMILIHEIIKNDIFTNKINIAVLMAKMEVHHKEDLKELETISEKLDNLIELVA
jgi:hypothetical protein